MQETTTIEIDKETHTLIRQYCVLNNIKVKDFVRDITNENLDEFKKKIEEMKRPNIKV